MPTEEEEVVLSVIDIDIVWINSLLDCLKLTSRIILFLKIKIVIALLVQKIFFFSLGTLGLELIWLKVAIVLPHD